MPANAIQLPPCCWGIITALAPILGLLAMKCAWCGALLGVKRAQGAPGGVSDGACGRCIEKELGGKR